MHTVWVRLNNVVFFALTLLLAMASLCAISTVPHEGMPVVSQLDVSHLRSLRSSGKSDKAVLSFNLRADMSPAFHWNMKQLFVMVVAEYETKPHSLNQIVLWDKIIEDPNAAKLSLKSELVKYSLTDRAAELRGKEVTLKLVWEYMPLTGLIGLGAGTSNSYTFPAKYKL